MPIRDSNFSNVIPPIIIYAYTPIRILLSTTENRHITNRARHGKLSTGTLLPRERRSTFIGYNGFESIIVSKINLV